MFSNAASFGVAPSGTIDHFINSIDTSNTVDSKPIQYLVNKTNQHVSGEPGYVAIVNSTGMTIENLTLGSNLQGILAAYSSQINVTNVQSTPLFAPYDGIDFYEVDNSTVQNTNLAGDAVLGIMLDHSDNNLVANNVISSSFAGISLHNSMDCSIVANNLSNYNTVFDLDTVNGSVFFHNNILGSAHCFIVSPSGAKFDNGYEGNYWIDYHGLDVNGTGINLPPYPIDMYNYDNCPLIKPWSATRIFNRNWTAKNPIITMKLSTCSNSTLSSSIVFTRYDSVIVGGMNFSKGRFSLNVTAGYQGFLNVTIPRNWLDGIFDVLVDGGNVGWDETGNATISSVYFAFGPGAHAIKIEGFVAGNIPGDINGDGIVSLSDLVLLANNYGSTEHP
jgi:parallel beta-helix repeat protein